MPGFVGAQQILFSMNEGKNKLTVARYFRTLLYIQKKKVKKGEISNLLYIKKEKFLIY